MAEKYEIWHDEYKGDDSVNEYWHGIYFVPVKSRQIIIEMLKKIRDEHEIPLNRDVKFAGSLNSAQKSRVTGNHLQLFAHSLIRKEKDALSPLYNRDGEKRYKRDFTPYSVLKGVWGCKFVLMKIPDNHESMKGLLPSYADRVETTFRMAMRGGLHFLFKDPIEISKFTFDGNEHHGRTIDRVRITKGDFWEHVVISENVLIDDRQRSERGPNTNIMINLVDHAIGSFPAVMNEVPDKDNALEPIREITGRAVDGKLNLNINGRWYKSISLSQMNVVNGEIEFSNLFLSPKQERLL